MIPPLDPSLAEYQAIDFRVMAASHTARLDTDRNLLPGQRELWNRRFLDSSNNNHLCHVNSDIITKAALQLLTIIEGRVK